MTATYEAEMFRLSGYKNLSCYDSNLLLARNSVQWRVPLPAMEDAVKKLKISVTVALIVVAVVALYADQKMDLAEQ